MRSLAWPILLLPLLGTSCATNRAPDERAGAAKEDATAPAPPPRLDARSAPPPDEPPPQAIPDAAVEARLDSGVAGRADTRPAGPAPDAATQKPGAPDGAAPPATAPIGDGAPLFGPWRHRDVGAVKLPGDAAHADGTFTIRASGDDVFHGHDQFHFVFQPLRGDGEIVARVATQERTHNWSKAGVMFRTDLETDAPAVVQFISPVATSQMMFRTKKKEYWIPGFGPWGPAVKAPYWVRLVRKGDEFTGYISSDGKTWQKQRTSADPPGPMPPLPETLLVGLAVTAHDANALNTSTFDNVTVTPAAP